MPRETAQWDVSNHQQQPVNCFNQRHTDTKTHHCRSRYCPWPRTHIPTRQHGRHAPSWPPPLHRWRRPCQPTPCSCLPLQTHHNHMTASSIMTITHSCNCNPSTHVDPLLLPSQSGSTVATAPSERASATSWRMMRINTNDIQHLLEMTTRKQQQHRHHKLLYFSMPMPTSHVLPANCLSPLNQPTSQETNQHTTTQSRAKLKLCIRLVSEFE